MVKNVILNPNYFIRKINQDLANTIKLYSIGNHKELINYISVNYPTL
jgi:hypothetical protein